MQTYELPDGLGGVVEFVTVQVNENEFMSMSKAHWDELQAQQAANKTTLEG